MNKPRIEVEWDDAHHIIDSWSSLEDIAATYKAGSYRISNVGWLLYEDKIYIIIGSKHSKNWQDWGGVMFIPKCLIRKRKKL